jgi:hypothetical protein
MSLAETIAAVRRHAAIMAAAAALRRARGLAEQSQSRLAAQNKARQNEAQFGETKLTGITAEVSMGSAGSLM